MPNADSGRTIPHRHSQKADAGERYGRPGHGRNHRKHHVRTTAETETSSDRVEPIVRSLRARLGESVDAGLIVAEVEAELAAFAAARLTQFVPILVESRVRNRLHRRCF